MAPKKSNREMTYVDPSSFSNPDKVKVEEINIFWDISFEKHTLEGKVHLTCKKNTDPSICVCDTNFLYLDTRDLNIKKVSDLAGGELSFKFGTEHPKLGTPLRIDLPNQPGSDGKYKICIEYETSSTATALQWLTAEQTLGKQEPFMFSQCQSIHCRSIIPCQDTPYVKCPYKAEVTAPKQLMVLMSAIKSEEPTTVDGKLLWKYSQDIPIPSYLIAIAAGRLKGKLLGLKSMIYAEPEIIQECVFEFSETDKMLKAATDICGPYVWGRYDLLVLPPSFAYGGMENPCLTFVTPTLLAGDRSLANVIAHEIAHSWTGNLVTNSTFEHFWLNEGFTTFIERKIQGAMFGEAHRHFHAFLGLSFLKDVIVNNLGEDNPLTCLVVDLEQSDPEAAFSSVPYEKGHTFLFYFEQLMADQALFNEFLKSYIQKFKFQSITTDDFKAYAYEFFKDADDVLDTIDWNTWFYSPGMPPVIPDYDKTLIKDVENLVEKWVQWNPTDQCIFGQTPFSYSDIEGFSSSQTCLFFTKLWESGDMKVVKLKLMEQVYKLSDIKNCEIRCIWIRLCIKADWKEKIPEALKFVNEQGRMKYCRPIYKELFYSSEEGRIAATNNFLENKKYMMYVLVSNIEKDLGFDLM
ncbi:UNVERIFIED_CONTAM: hypothetical protein PYX00_000646 [Menopon gallinae]|uniref:Peptidase M1 leukotriene A4 hydrolase/aminopeptidase C-terminal domain-containing protein n=1 Tax=Menopon gallinae TaxID=328185 RepID=A0AAW2IB70_9NEOP